ncbi:hypothetical protein F2Q69_00037234 [Brassica cretica]|uniref:Uncharacterized protein n=1 Tax=Brassica cretica TaxID=69181 RepID=A0A8S9STQ3_BRACR|nr:hypothetical protein F2Q69_00037234 [Brassica cretica]
MTARFLNDVQVPGARAFYGFQIAMENIHSGMVLYAEKYGLGQSQMFSVLISLQSLKISLRKRMKTSLAKIDNVYIEMPTLLRSVSSHMEKDRLFNAIETIPCISNKAKWCLDRIQSLLQKQLPLEKVYQIVHEAVEIETEFVCKALPCDFNWNELKPYEPVTLGCDRRYKAENPFDWMEFISLHETLSVPKKKGRLVGLGRRTRSVPPSSAPPPFVDPEVLTAQLKDKDDRISLLETQMAAQQAGYEAQRRLNQQMMEMMQRMYPNEVFPDVPDP